MAVAVKIALVGWYSGTLRVSEGNINGCVTDGCLVLSTEKWSSWLPFDDVMEVWRSGWEESTYLPKYFIGTYLAS
jgi:hypothetical protein